MGGSGSNGGRDFTSENRNQGGEGGSGAGRNNGGGRDFTKESRPQSEAKAEVVPNSNEIPTGGKDLKADAMPVSAKVAGTADGPNERRPFKIKG